MNRLILDGNWRLASLTNPEIQTDIVLPGDVHSALLATEIIPNPYWATNEKEVQWVSEHDWQINRTFDVSSDLLAHNVIDLSMSMVDTMANIELNGETVLECSNMFRLYQANVRSFLVEGENTLTITIKRADLEAAVRAEKLPFPVPWAVGNNQIPHMNTLRKTQCHSGWDWGICLLTSGVYAPIELIARQQYRLNSFVTEQTWQGEHCQLNVAVDLDMLADADSNDVVCAVLTSPSGEILEAQTEASGNATLTFDIENPQRWWPAGYGKQPLYTLTVSISNQSISKKNWPSRVRAGNLT